jgi:hypothetical protein
MLHMLRLYLNNKNEKWWEEWKEDGTVGNSNVVFPHFADQPLFLTAQLRPSNHLQII